MKLKIFVGAATHFLRWELPHFAAQFELVDEPAADAILFAFGPDVLEAAAELPALRRVALLFPGFGRNPYHNLEYRRQVLQTIDEHYDLVLVNPGALEVAYRESNKVVVCPVSVDTSLFPHERPRTKLNSLLHASNDSPQKDWPRSEHVMKLTGLRYEVFPPRRAPDAPPPFPRRVKAKINYEFERRGRRPPLHLLPHGYVNHADIIRKYWRYDGFVHVASEVPLPNFIDGKYTATILEAGLTGAIVFWHDTLQLGNDFETIFNLPVEPELAAQKILEIRDNLDVKKHSIATRRELLEKCDPARAVAFRAQKIRELF